MNSRCPNSSCHNSPSRVCKDGFYRRTSDSKKVQRYRCKACKCRFSAATNNRAFGHNKRRLNSLVARSLCSGESMRRTALNLRTSRKTVARKLAWNAKFALIDHQKELSRKPKVKDVQFDDLLTIEHTKCKPLSVSMAVEHPTRQILGFEVSVIPASGLLAAISKEKYGPRPNERPEGLHRLFEQIQPFVEPDASFSSDDDPLYPGYVRTYFPKGSHRRVKGGRGCITGQGELKKLKFDPIFSLNHTFAMLRANITRLFRRTWCTTKRHQCLAQHLAIYMRFHNTVLLPK